MVTSFVRMMMSEIDDSVAAAVVLLLGVIGFFRSTGCCLPALGPLQPTNPRTHDSSGYSPHSHGVLAEKSNYISHFGAHSLTLRRSVTGWGNECTKEGAGKRALPVYRAICKNNTFILRPELWLTFFMLLLTFLKIHSVIYRFFTYSPVGEKVIPRHLFCLFTDMPKIHRYLTLKRLSKRH